MATRWNLPGNPDLQMGPRLIASPLRRILAGLLVVALLATSAVGVATSTAVAETVTPTAAATATVTPKPTPKPSIKPTPAKKVVEKAEKKPARKKVRIAPSPKPVWPPKGFTVADDVYAKLPTPKELVGIISAQKYLANLIKKCDDVICGSVQVASETGCIWWEVLSTVVARNGRKLGDLKTAHGATNPREIKTFLIISPEPVAPGLKVVMRSVICHRGARDKSNPSIQYLKVELPSASPTPSG